MKVTHARAVASVIGAAVFFSVHALACAAPALRAAAVTPPYDLFVGSTHVEYSSVFLKRDGDVFYITPHSEPYFLYTYKDQLGDYASLRAGTGEALEYAAQQQNGYGWDLGQQAGSFDIRLAYYYLGEYAEDVISVRVAEETALSRVYAVAGDWQTDGTAFSGDAESGELTLLIKSDRDLRLEAEGTVSVYTDGEAQQINGVLPLHASDGVSLVTLSASSPARVRIAESEPVALTLSYNDMLGTVRAGDDLLPPDTYSFEKGTRLSLSFLPQKSVSSSIRPEENVPCAFTGYSLGGSHGTEDTLSLTLNGDLALSVDFAEALPSLPSGGVVRFTASDGAFEKRSFTDGAALTLAGAKNAELLLPSPDAGETCTASINGNEQRLLPSEGYYRLPLSEAENNIRINLAREGYLPATFSLSVRICASVTSVSLSEDNVYERIFDADGDILQDYSLSAVVSFSDGTEEVIPLSFSDGDGYLFTSTLSNPDHGFETQHTLFCSPASFALYREQAEAFAQAPDTDTARQLLADYTALLEGHTEEEQAYARSKLPVASVLAALFSCPLSCSADAAWEEVYSLLLSRLNDAGIPQGFCEVFLSVGGERLTEENFSRLWKGGTFPVLLSANGETVQAASLLVPPKQISVNTFQTSFTYTGKPISPFDWEHDLQGLLPSAAEGDFSVRYLREDGSETDRICNAGKYFICLSVTDSSAYLFAPDTPTRFTVTVAKADLSEELLVSGIRGGETLTEGASLALQLNFPLRYNLYLSRDGEPADPAAPLAAGNYTLRVVLRDDNYCGSTVLAFSVTIDGEDAADALEALLAQLEQAQPAERLSVLLTMRETASSALSQGIQTQRFLDVLARCKEAWRQYVNTVREELAGTPSPAANGASALAVLNDAACLIAASLRARSLL